MADALDLMQTAMESEGAHQVATVNVDFVVRAQADRWLNAILHRTYLNLVDGTPLVWALRAFGNPVSERVAGSDFVPPLLARAAREGFPVYLLGGTESSAERAANKILTAYPGLRLVGVDAPPRAPIERLDPGTVARIRAAAPKLLLVALGNPKQEYWLDLHLEETGVPLGIGIGGTIDFLSESRQRAPHWMRRAGLEWTARLFQEPVRLGPRYARDSVGLAQIVLQEALR